MVIQTFTHGFRTVQRCIQTFMIPVLLALVIAWSMQLATIQQVLSPLVVNKNEQPLYIPPTVQFGPGSNQVAYDVWVVDDRGNEVFRYPRMMFDSGKMDLNQVRIKFPDNLTRGVYRVKGVVHYRLNPLITSEVAMELAQVTVTNM